MCGTMRFGLRNFRLQFMLTHSNSKEGCRVFQRLKLIENPQRLVKIQFTLHPNAYGFSQNHDAGIFLEQNSHSAGALRILSARTQIVFGHISTHNNCHSPLSRRTANPISTQQHGIKRRNAGKGHVHHIGIVKNRTVLQSQSPLHMIQGIGHGGFSTIQRRFSAQINLTNMSRVEMILLNQFCHGIRCHAIHRFFGRTHRHGFQTQSHVEFSVSDSSGLGQRRNGQLVLGHTVSDGVNTDFFHGLIVSITKL